MTAEVFMRHQEHLDRRGFQDRCPGSLVITERVDPTWIVLCDKCGWEAGVPAREISPRHRVALRSESAGFPAMFTGRQFETTAANEPVKQIIRQWIDEFGTNPLPAPAIYGQPGRGKSHLLVATCEQLLKRHDITIRFWPVAGLLDELQDAFGDNQRHRKVWQDATTVDVLALDDLGAEQVTEWRAERLARLVDERYQNERPVLVATNYPPAAWEHTVGGRTVSRLLGMTMPIELKGDDRRIAA